MVLTILSVLIDGNYGTDFASNNRGFSFVIDFGKVVKKFPWS